MTVAKQILSNTAIQVLGKIVTASVSLITIKYITSLETIPGLEGLPAEYKLIYTYLLFFGIVADFGLFTVAVREISQAPSEDDKRFIMSNIFGLRLSSVVLAMLLAVFCVFLLPFENYTPTVKIGVAIAAITTVFTMLASTSSAILQVKLKMGVPTLAIIIGKVITAAYIITIVQHYQSVPFAFYHLLLAGVIGAFISFYITLRYTKRVFPFKAHLNKKYWSNTIKQALPYGVAVILNQVYLKLDLLLISFLRNKKEIALYGFPTTMTEMLLIFPVYFMNSVLPTLSRHYKSDKTKASQTAQLALQFLLTMGIPLVVGGVILAKPIISLVMNDVFLSTSAEYGADVAFQIIVVSTLFAFINTLLGFTLIATGNQHKLLPINLIGVVFNTITNIVFIPHYGFVAAGVTTVLSEILMVFLLSFTVKKHLFIAFPLKLIVKLVFASAIMGLAIFWLQFVFPVLVVVGIGGILYFASLFPLRAFPRELMRPPTVSDIS